MRYLLTLCPLPLRPMPDPPTSTCYGPLHGCPSPSPQPPREGCVILPPHLLISAC